MNKSELARYKFYQLKHRFDKRDEGYWITTKNGHKVFIDENGEVAKGNPIVVGYMKSNEFSKYKIKLSATESKKLTESINRQYDKKYKGSEGELCGHEMDNTSYLFFNITKEDYIPLHKVDCDKEGKEDIRKIIKSLFKDKDIVNCFTDMTKADADKSNIKKYREKEDYFFMLKK